MKHRIGLIVNGESLILVVRLTNEPTLSKNYKTTETKQPNYLNFYAIETL